jgi:predicted Zn finger-like uncharacterized protein
MDAQGYTEMVESFITQCPHCGTSFRVRSEQLAVANGSVRCGACLQVFGARNHLVTSPLSGTRPAAAPTAKTSAPKPATKKASPSQPAPRAPAAPQTGSKFGGFSADDGEFVFADGDDDFIFDDNADDRLFGDDASDEGFGELSDSFRNLDDSARKPNRKVDHFQRETQELNKPELTDPNEQDERWAESILEELENDSRPKPKSKPAVFDTQDVNRRKAGPVSKPIAPVRMSADFEPDFPMPQTASQVVNKVNHAPDLDFHLEDRLHRLRPLGWIAVVALLIVLVGQLAWLERSHYARMDQWRGLYQSACDILGCSLPAQVDLDKIRSSLLVREHKDPNLKDLRMVDIVLTNRAPFKQAFPLLLLQYTDVNGKLVADQQYYPDEYLKGELTGVELMPINTRIYVSLAIRTPVAGAVNYQLLLSPS